MLFDRRQWTIQQLQLLMGQQELFFKRQKQAFGGPDTLPSGGGGVPACLF